MAYNPNPYLCSQGLSYLQEMLNLVDVLILAKQAAIKLIGNREPPELAKYLAKQGSTIIAISDGANGVTIDDKESSECFQVIPDPDILVVETTGAGDAFGSGSGFVSGLVRDKNVKESALLGVLNAEDVIRAFGAHEHRIDRNTLDKKLTEEMSKNRFRIY